MRLILVSGLSGSGKSVTSLSILHLVPTPPGATMSTSAPDASVSIASMIFT